MALGCLDKQLQAASTLSEAPNLSAETWSKLATTIHDEIAALDELTIRQLRADVLIPPERYLEELDAFQRWMEIAHANRSNPVIVRAQVMTELYVAFVWLRDSLMTPLGAALPDGSAFSAVERFLRAGTRRRLRNAIAHGHWCYLPDYSGLEFWSELHRGQPHERFVIHDVELGNLQLLSRGTAIAALLALSTAIDVVGDHDV